MENVEINKIVDVDIEQEMQKSFLDYSMSVIVSRALPDVRDGLKPVHRRILYTLFENNLGPDKAYRKCADTVGSVLGRYHPHGDGSVYDALVRLAQNFSSRYTLVDGHGNFGSVDGDPAAAYRYTEAKMSKISVEMLTDIDKDTVDFMRNYDDRLDEPTVLTSRFPNLMVNGSTGIAVGMATNIPPHNLREVVDTVCCLIEKPEATLQDLMQHIKGPDFPTGALIMGQAGILAAYSTGRGKVIVRAKTEIVEGKNGRSKILVTELPYQVNKARLCEAIADLVKDKRIEGISNIEDHSDRDGMCICIDVKRDAQAAVVLNQLFSYTQLQTTFGVNTLAIVDGQPKILTLHDMLKNYIKFQISVLTRRTQFDLRKAKEREHILQGLKIAIDHIDEVIEILRSSKSVAEGKTRLMERFDLDDAQATAIVQMRLGQLTGLERGKIEGELDELRAKIVELLGILGDENKLLSILKDELLRIKSRFGDERRTEIVPISGELATEELIVQEECMVTLTEFGYLKRQKLDTYKQQKRGGRGMSGMSRRDDDMATEMFVASTHDFLFLFTNKGRVYKLKCYEIPESSRTARGTNIVNLVQLQEGEKVTALIKIPDLEEEKFLVMVTRGGVIKRTELGVYKNARKAGVIAIDLDEGDELAWVGATDGSAELLLATKKGMAIRFRETDVRAVGRQARGVKALSLSSGDVVVGMTPISGDSLVLTVSQTGCGRLSSADDYRLQSRGGKGLINYHVKRYGDVAAVRRVDSDDDIIIISSDGVVIRLAANSVRRCARPSKGVQLMRVPEGARVVSVARIPREAEETAEDVAPEAN